MHDVGERERAQPGRILLAEDQPVNQWVMVAMLEQLGYQVDVASDGPEAVKAATGRAYRAILMDCQLPLLDGFGATREIRRLEGAVRHTPVIAVTGSATFADRLRCLAAGMDDYLAKPLRLKKLAAILDRWTAIGSVPASALETVAPQENVLDADRPVLDPEVVGRLERLDDSVGEDLLGQLTSLFLADSEVQIGALRQAFAAGDAAAAARSAHILSGTSANLGATALAQLCDALAAEGAPGSPAPFEAIEAELGRVREALSLPAPTP